MSDTYLTRQTLLRRLKSKSDEQSWEEFVLHYGNFIRSIINKMGVNPDSFDDLSQQVMLKIWNSIASFDHSQKKGSFRNWIYTITRRTVLTSISQDKAFSKKVDSLAQESEDQFSCPEVDEMIEEEWNKHISKLAFEKIGKKVGPQLLDAFVSGITKEPVEITAERLGLSEKTVYIYRHRIKKALADEIKNLKEMLE